MRKGLNYPRLKEPGFPFGKTLEPMLRKSRFPIDGESSECSYTCCKCGIPILADPRDVPTQCLECESLNSYIRTDAYNELMNIPC
jgi:hypothetical protein